jgi:hypothetical protein
MCDITLVSGIGLPPVAVADDARAMTGSDSATNQDAASRLAGKVIVVTGAGSGFGRLTSEMAAARGARIVAADVDGEAVAATVIDTPWAVTISDITVRATGEDYVL